MTGAEHCLLGSDDAMNFTWPPAINYRYTLLAISADAEGKVDLLSTLEHFGTIGINKALVEAGTGLTTAFLSSALADKIYWMQSSHILGSDSRSVVGPLKLVALPPQNRYTQQQSSLIGEDQLRVFVQNASEPKEGQTD